MVEDAETHSDSPALDRSERRRIRELCSRYDFPLAEVEEEGQVLVLIPRSIEEIPDSDRLGELAHRLSREGHRHVAFSIRAR